MGKSCEVTTSGECNMSNESSRSRPDGILLCTTPDGKKHKGMNYQLLQSAYRTIPIHAATPNSLPESIYNGPLSQEAGMIAAIKVLQLAKKHPGVTHALFGNTNNIQMVANDIILDIGCGQNAKWQTFNKPDQNATKQNIKHQLMTMLSSSNCSQIYKEGRFRMGGAAFNPEQMRGVYGQEKLIFWFTPFSENEIDEYINSTEHSDLLNTNGSCRWDHDIFTGRIIQIENVGIADKNFHKAYTHFTDILTGSLPGISTLIEQSQHFASLRSLGHNTGQLNTIVSEILNHDSAGNWGEWRTESIFPAAMSKSA